LNSTPTIARKATPHARRAADVRRRARRGRQRDVARRRRRRRRQAPRADPVAQRPGVGRALDAVGAGRRPRGRGGDDRRDQGASLLINHTGPRTTASARWTPFL